MYHKNFDLEVKDGILTLVSKTEFNIVCSKTSSTTDLEIDQLNPWFYNMNASTIASDDQDENQVSVDKSIRPLSRTNNYFIEESDRNT